MRLGEAAFFLVRRSPPLTPRAYCRRRLRETGAKSYSSCLAWHGTHPPRVLHNFTSFPHAQVGAPFFYSCIVLRGGLIVNRRGHLSLLNDLCNSLLHTVVLKLVRWNC